MSLAGDIKINKLQMREVPIPFHSINEKKHVMIVVRLQF